MILLSMFDGGLQLQDQFLTLSAKEIKELANSVFVGQDVIPVAIDRESQQALCLRLQNESMVIWDLEDNIMMEDLKMPGGLGQYLEELRDKILSKKLIYEDGLGLVSVR